jgi:putative hydrolase of the HAD superfamily
MTTLSFDLWGTLISPNPQFAEKRFELLRGLSQKSDSEIHKIVHFIKTTYDNAAVSSEYVFNLLKNTLAIPLSITELMSRYSAVFGEYPPLLIEKDINAMLAEAHKTHAIHLISNTLMIKGYVLKDVLNERHEGIFNHFDSLTFSDEVGVAKPDAAIYAKAYTFMNDVPKQTVLHIGDNRWTDFQGALDFGFQAALVDFSESKTIRHILTTYNVI